MKRCTKCGEEKDESEFYKNKSSKGGVNSKCKVCVKLQTKLWQLKNNDHRKQYLKDRNAKIHFGAKYSADFRKKNNARLLVECKVRRDKSIQELRDNYVRRILYQQGVRNPEHEIIETKRVILLINRTIKEQQNGNSSVK